MPTLTSKTLRSTASLALAGSWLWLAACGGHVAPDGGADGAADSAAADSAALHDDALAEAGADALDAAAATEASAPDAPSEADAALEASSSDSAPALDAPEREASASAPDAQPDTATDALASDAASDATSDAASDAATSDALAPCASGSERCPGSMVCSELASDPQHCGACGNACVGGRACVAGRCACPAGQLECGGRCVDPAGDDAHCGMCGRACPSAQRCSAGACGCVEGRTACGDRCVNAATDTANCGACGVACGAGQRCEAGRCACPEGQTACGAGAAATCVDARADRANCGACGTACASEQLCEAGRCVCPAGQALCDGRCVNTQTDAAHCGACGRACPAGQLCNGGVCGLSCGSGRMVCGSGAAMVCADLRSDDAHCGACNNACGPVANSALSLCNLSRCVPVCNPGFGSCDLAFANGCETNTNTDGNHCGACGNACPTTAPGASSVACAAGACRASCLANRADCDGAVENGCEVDPRTDANHCGACGNACGAGQVCVGGVCSAESCRTLLARQPGLASGVYPIDPDGPGPLPAAQLYCDMTTLGGGWTLVQRTTATWSDTMQLMTNEAAARDTTVGATDAGRAFRLALRYWPALQGTSEHLLRFVTATREGPECAPLFYRARNVRWDVPATGPMYATVLPGASGTLALVNQYRSATMLRFNALGDDTPAGAGCVAGNNGVPWMYEAFCCNFCPTFSYFGVPRPMTNIVNSPDEFGRSATTPGLCPAGTTAMVDRPPPGYYGGTSAEYYLR